MNIVEPACSPATADALAPYLGQWDILGGTLSRPGQIHWYRFDQEGTYSFAMTSSSNAQYRVYQAADLTTPAPPFKQETTDAKSEGSAHREAHPLHRHGVPRGEATVLRARVLRRSNADRELRPRLPASRLCDAGDGLRARAEPAARFRNGQHGTAEWLRRSLVRARDRGHSVGLAAGAELLRRQHRGERHGRLQLRALRGQRRRTGLGPRARRTS